MKIKNLITIYVLLLVQYYGTAQNKTVELHTIAFYNFENLFDTINNPNNDEEWLPNGSQNWTGDKYKQKLKNLLKRFNNVLDMYKNKEEQ